ncbi:MAG: aminopeptidase N, partial [Inquilinus sp.]|nr:aminopeptidase N [Inquilinus sp.]
RPGDLDKCGHAMRSLQKSMAWDEEVYGLEYDLDRFMIVAVSDFNMGAMENKGLNIFNSKYVLASAETATDSDYDNIEGIIAHEYFHNWTGNRVTCRDWFQLSLKEGLTVFRDQQFSADMGSAAVKRIHDVRRLRATQFPEDSGPTAHPVRPESYIEINNFYTPTVYVKGAEVVRMIHTLIGATAFRAGTDLYFERHDGQAVTIEDFVTAMEDASGIDLSQFRRWYTQAGTPQLTVDEAYVPEERAYTLTVRQKTPPTPGQPAKRPLMMPLAVSLLDETGKDVPATLNGEPQSGTQILTMTETEQRFRFEDVPSRPIPSLLRGFSAPVKLAPRPRDQLRFLFAHDGDPFARWEAGQQLASQLLLEMVAAHQSGEALSLDPDFVAAFGKTLDDPSLDQPFVAEALSLPGESFLADQMATVDVDAIHIVRETARREIALQLGDRLRAVYCSHHDAGPYRLDTEAMGRRALKNLCLAYLTARPDDEDAIGLAAAQFQQGGNMTDVRAALGMMADIDHPARQAAFDAFYAKWRADPLMLDVWFSVQAQSSLTDTPAAVGRLTEHADFDWRNPNRVRSLIAAFATGNPCRFHAADGAGYRLLADAVLTVERLNPQLAARLLVPLGRWRRQDERRQQSMRQALERILSASGLSRDVYEIASKSLA